jgi:thiamine-phosphate pyrophosphorylase
MLIVVSNPTVVANEAQLINTLFDEGLELFHLRKPTYLEDEIKFLLEGIQFRHLAKVVLHSHHELAAIFGINRLHYPEQKRSNSNNNECMQLNERGNILSTSIHDVKEIKMLSSCFNYAFFGPVFNSISKQGYDSIVPDDFRIENNNVKIVAIGGISRENLISVKKMGFAGAAVLGTIWQSIYPIQEFKQLQKIWSDL